MVDILSSSPNAMKGSGNNNTGLHYGVYRETSLIRNPGDHREPDVSRFAAGRRWGRTSTGVLTPGPASRRGACAHPRESNPSTGATAGGHGLTPLCFWDASGLMT